MRRAKVAAMALAGVIAAGGGAAEAGASSLQTVAKTSVAAASAKAKARRLTCASGRTWLADSGTRIFSLTIDEIVWDYYGCTGRQQRPRKLVAEEPDSGTLVGQLAFAGRFAAYDQLSCGREGSCSGTVGVVDLRSGRRRTVAATRYSVDAVSTVDPASALIVGGGGSAAWIRPVGGGSAEVVVWEAGQAPLVVDTVPAADGRSLAVAAGVVYWTNAGQPRSAPLP